MRVFSCLCVCLSVSQTMPHDSQSLQFSDAKISAELKRGHSSGGTKCRWSRLNAGGVTENWLLSTQSVVSLARLQVFTYNLSPYRDQLVVPFCSVI